MANGIQFGDVLPHKNNTQFSTGRCRTVASKHRRLSNTFPLVRDKLTVN